jgi:hypothetical protein
MCVGVAGALAGGAAVGQVEVSKDGLRTVAVMPSVTDGSGSVVLGSGVPFGTQPDQQVDLRRQIAGLQVVDANNDGLNDVVAVCYISNSFPPYEHWRDQIFLNVGGGIELEPSWLSDIETHTGDVRVGDISGDGFVDVMTVHGGGLRKDNVRVYFGSESGPSTTAGYVSDTPLACWGTSGLLVDLDNDGDLDAVTTNQGLFPESHRPMYQFENDGAGIGEAPVWESAEYSLQHALDAGDYDNDGFLDVAVSKWVGFESGIYRNDNGTLEPDPVFTVGTDGADRGASFADVDDNGWPDVAYGGHAGDVAELWANDAGDLTKVWEAETPFQGPEDFRFFDVDGDGDEDLAEIHFGDGKCHIYLNEGGVLATLPSWTYDAEEVGTALAFGDINGDGLDDLVTGYSGDTSIRVFFAEPASCPGDFNGDGALNILDFVAFQGAFTSGDPSADCDGSGALDILDFVCFQNVFSAGCG